MRSLFRATMACVLLAGVLFVGAAPATAHPGNGGEPLPGYTIQNPPLPPLVINGEETRVKQGTHNHAAYIIEVPSNWNGDLVMWAHGFRGQGTVLYPDTPAFGLRAKLLNQGYAWAASSYYANGYDIKAGVLSTKDLAVLFRTVVRPPHRTYITGVSMGGHVIGRSLEQYPGFYAGALPMCGVLGDQVLFDYFLDYNLAAQTIAGVPAYPVPADYLTTAVPRIQVTLGLAGLRPGGPDTTNDLGKQLRAITANRSGGPRPGTDAAFAIWNDYLFGLAVPGDGETPAQRPGQIATNVFTRYTPNTPVDVNSTVPRIRPENLAQRLSPGLTQIPKIAGRPSAPVLTLHNLGDLFVPFSMEQAYATDVAWHGKSRLLVQRAIRSAQHCEFSPIEVGTAWDDLVRWVRAGKKPAGDDVRRTSAETYGCRFTDATAYATGTRPLYSACPA